MTYRASPPTALIVGAGIGGLAAGLVLRRSGWRVRIYERASTARELGFALGLAANAMAALRELELDVALSANSVSPTKVAIRRPDGRTIRTFNAGMGGRIVIALRQTLHGELLRAVGQDALALNSEVVAIASKDGGVSLTLRDGSRVDGDLLVGADGIGSIVRQQLHPNERPPQPSGFCAIRGIAYDVGDQLGDLGAIGYLGDGVEAAIARAGQHAVYWYVSLLEQEIALDAPDAARLIARYLPSFDSPFRSIASATHSRDMRFDVLLHRAALSKWGRGAMTLLGDAAHPLLPHTGQGAAQALEDAIALGLALSHHLSIEDALRRYEQVRSQRTRRFIRMGRHIARITTTRNPFIQWARTLMIRSIPSRLLANLGAASSRDPHRALRPHVA
jgi:2-polyprenyl-6-methoxyphenol hydroxylase-like FAD-dependent oxidoreductase